MAEPKSAPAFNEHEEKEKFLRREMFNLAFAGMSQRGCIYKNVNEISETQKSALRTRLRELLEQYESDFNQNTSIESLEEKHLTNLKALSDTVSCEFPDILDGGKFRIGSAQKLLNLYLKYLWCLGLIGEPPHCPFDANIIAVIEDELPDGTERTWTQTNDLKSYRAWVHAANRKAHAEGLSVPQWELTIFNKLKKIG